MQTIISCAVQVQQRFELLKKRKDTGGFTEQGNIWRIIWLIDVQIIEIKAFIFVIIHCL